MSFLNVDLKRRKEVVQTIARHIGGGHGDFE